VENQLLRHGARELWAVTTLQISMWLVGSVYSTECCCAEVVGATSCEGFLLFHTAACFCWSYKGKIRIWLLAVSDMSWTCGAASVHTTAAISRTMPSPCNLH